MYRELRVYSITIKRQVRPIDYKILAKINSVGIYNDKSQNMSLGDPRLEIYFLIGPFTDVCALFAGGMLTIRETLKSQNLPVSFA